VEEVSFGRQLGLSVAVLTVPISTANGCCFIASMISFLGNGTYPSYAHLSQLSSMSCMHFPYTASITSSNFTRIQETMPVSLPTRRRKYFMTNLPPLKSHKNCHEFLQH
jgi:hypothetical protein